MNHITREQFEIIRPILESARITTKPRTVDLYDIICAIFYLTKSGCQWRMLPSDFPKWQNCYAYFQKWSEEICDENGTITTTLEEVQKKINSRCKKS